MAGDEVDNALAAYQTTVDRLNGLNARQAPVPSADPGSQAAAPSGFLAPRPPTAAIAALPDPELMKALEDKRRQIRVYEDMHERELETLKQQLLQSQLTLTPQHPTVIALQQKVDNLSQPSIELNQLKSEERSLMAQIAPPSASAGGGGVVAPGSAPRYLSPDSLLNSLVRNKAELEDPGVAAARSKLGAVMERYQGIMSRLDSARLELDMTRTAFRYRYSVATPAEVPRRPSKATAPLIGVAAVLMGLLLAFGCPALADWQAGRILETWQIRRHLKIEVLGEMDPPL
jgi:hypothetical protein